MKIIIISVLGQELSYYRDNYPPDVLEIVENQIAYDCYFDRVSYKDMWE